MINYTSEELSKMDVIDDKYLSDLLHKLRGETFDFQGRLQSDNIVMDKVHCQISDFKRKMQTFDARHVAQYKAVNYMEYQFINPQRKLALKRSGYLGREVNFYEISKNYQVFDKNYMAFIGGELVDCVNIIAREDGVDFTINVNGYGNNPNGISHVKYKEWVVNDSKVDIVIFSNSLFNPLVVDRPTLFANKNNLSQINTGFLDSLSSEHTYLSFVKGFESGAKSRLVHHPNRDVLLEFYREHNVTFNNNKAFINIYGFKNLAENITVSSTSDIIQIAGFKMPVPVENIMVFLRTPSGYSYSSEVKITLRFPNFYEIDNTTGFDLSLLVFYSDGNEKSSNYIDPLKPYFDVMGNTATSFSQAPELVTSYQPPKLDFSIREFMDNGDTDPLFYKIKKLAALTKTEPDFIRQFYKDRNENIDGYYVNVKNINLADRIRKSNEDEVEGSHPVFNFDEDHYVLTLKDPFEQGRYDISIFIDGAYFNAKRVFTKGLYTYVYVPVSSIHGESIIEIERTRIHAPKKSYKTFNNDVDILTIEVVPDRLSIADFDFINLDTNEIIPRDKFQYYTDFTDVYNRDHYEVMHDSSISITCADSSLHGVPIEVYYGRESTVNVFTTSTEGRGFSMEIDSRGIVENEKLRIFKNGRLIPPSFHHVKVDTITGVSKVLALVDHIPGDEIIIHHTPNDYKTILDIDFVPANGVLNLVGLIGRPFDLTWYDIYVNGKKLTKYNVDYMSPFIIKLKNIDSLDNLLILDRKRPVDIISFDHENGNVVDRLWYEDPVFRERLEDMDKNINPVEDDILTESLYWYFVHLIVFLDELDRSTGLIHLNPDLAQIPNEVRDRHSILFRLVHMKLYMNPDIGTEVDGPIVILHVNPDSSADDEYDADLIPLLYNLLNEFNIVKAN